MKFFRAAIVLAVVFSIWELIVIANSLPAYILPPPTAIFSSLVKHWKLLATNAWPTILETLLGLFLGGLGGVIAALSMSYFRTARIWFLPVVIVSQALPIFAIAPLLVIWFGYGMASKIVVTALMIFFPIAIAFYDGLRRTPRHWLYLGRVMGATQWSTLWRIRIPSALPALGSGLRMAATFAPMGAIIGEWVGASRGLGYLLINANARMQIDLMFATLLIVVLLTLSLYFITDGILKKIIFWE